MATDKQTIWLTEYYKCWNATAAARRAGYKSPDKQGQEVKAKFADEIKRHIEELQMSADEVLIRLADQARGSHADFTKVNLREDLKDHPKAHLVKSIVADVHEDSQGRVHHKLRLELYDAQAALVHIGKQNGLFSDKHIIEMRLEKEIDSILDTLEGVLPPELYSNVLAAISGPEAGGKTSTESQSAEVE